MAGLLIRGGEVVSHTGRHKADVLCEGETIRAVGPGLEAGPGVEVLDAAGMLVMPGGVDVHTHMELPVAGGMTSSDDFFTGTAAALAGGTTTIVDFVVPERGESLLAARDRWLAKGEKACADWALHMSVTHWSDQVRRELARVFADGITSFKTYLAYVDTIGVDDAALMSVLDAVGELGGLVMVHAEHGLIVKDRQRRLLAAGKRAPRFHADSRPPFVEAEAVGRALALARNAGQPLYVVHLSCAESLEVVTRARLDGVTVFAETCPHYLLLDDSAYERSDEAALAYVMSPPLRPKASQEALWEALGRRLVQTVATDHCPFTAADKRRGLEDFTLVPNGAGGVEHRLELMWTYGVTAGRLTVEQWVEACCTRPAQLFGLFPRKGVLQPGADADVVLFDPERHGAISAARHRQRTDLEIFDGFGLTGRIHATVARGRPVYRRGSLEVKPGQGKYLKREASGRAEA
jgi:dihydropyrimidinase